MTMPEISIWKSHQCSALDPRRPRLVPLRTDGPKRYESDHAPFPRLRMGCITRRWTDDTVPPTPRRQARDLRARKSWAPENVVSTARNYLAVLL